MGDAMHKMATSAFAFIFAVMLTSSCLHAASVDPEEMNRVADALTKVSAPVHSTVRYKNPATDLKDKALLDVALQDFPERLHALEGYVIKARQENKNSSVLVCDELGQFALVEDAGCTGAVDGRLWETHPNQPCDYVLTLDTICLTH